jgi:hypothetical protein
MTKTKIDRVAARPSISMWRRDELMTLAEAAALVFPDLLSERSLRHAAAEGRLPISVVCGRHYVTLEALEKLSICTSLTDACMGDEDTADHDADDSDLDEDLAAIRRIRNRR